MVELTDKQKLPELLQWAKQRQLEVIMIGSGSNIVWRDDGFEGLLIVNKLLGFETTQDGEDTFVTIGAGENWDSVAKRCSELSLNGVAELSLIPGTTGATPVQNVGAYGREISDVLVSVEAYDSQADRFVELTEEECSFGYRTSRFKTTDKGRFYVTAITLQLSKTAPQPPYYQALTEYFAVHHITSPTVQDVRMAVIALRSAKLPDPAIVANNGSFFANPIIGQAQFEGIANIPGIKHWEMEDGGIKLSAAWLIEKAGFKDYHDRATGMATWPTQPLVFVNEHAKTTHDLLTFKQKIVDAVKEKFGVELQQEPELLPA